MNLFISPLTGFSQLIFFNKNSEIIEKINLQRNQNFADVLFANKNWEQTKNIYFVSGPASFTTLRGMGVFLETLQKFSVKKYNFYSLTTSQFLEISYPITDTQLLSVGKRECFVFQTNENGKKEYNKCTNKELSKIKAYNNIFGGKEYLSENSKKEVSGEIIPADSQKKVLAKILQKKIGIKIKIDYGAKPKIG